MELAAAPPLSGGAPIGRQRCCRLVARTCHHRRVARTRHHEPDRGGEGGGGMGRRKEERSIAGSSRERHTKVVLGALDEVAAVEHEDAVMPASRRFPVTSASVLGSFTTNDAVCTFLPSMISLLTGDPFPLSVPAACYGGDSTSIRSAASAAAATSRCIIFLTRGFGSVGVEIWGHGGEDLGAWGRGGPWGGGGDAGGGRGRRTAATDAARRDKDKDMMDGAADLTSVDGVKSTGLA